MVLRKEGEALPPSAGRVGARWRRIQEAILGESDICGICGHPGSSDVEHIIARSERPDLAEDPDNLQPAHGESGRCYTCDPANGRNCNGEKGTKPMEDMLSTTIDWASGPNIHA
jgi:hypothetical protein